MNAIEKFDTIHATTNAGGDGANMNIHAYKNGKSEGIVASFDVIRYNDGRIEITLETSSRVKTTVYNRENKQVGASSPSQESKTIAFPSE